jgi:hypothetical protein
VRVEVVVRRLEVPGRPYCNRERCWYNEQVITMLMKQSSHH